MANTINCPVCGKLTDSRLDSCPHCGGYLKSRRQRPQAPAAKRGKTCPRCGSAVAEGDIICVACGTNLLTGQKIVDEAALRRQRQRALPAGWLIGGGIVAALLVVVGFLWIYGATRDPLSQAKRLAAQGETLEALTILEKYVARAPNDGPAVFEMARLQWQSQQFDNAAATFAKAAALDPDNEDAALFAARAAARSERVTPRELADLLERAVRLKQNDASLWYTLALARGASGDTAGAIEALERVIELRATDDSAHFSLGVAYGLDGRHALAATEFMTVGAARKADALAGLGFVEMMRGNPAEASRRLNEAVAAGGLPSAVQAYVALGRMQLEQGAFAEAQGNLESALAQDADDRQARFLRGLCLRARARVQEALPDFEALANAPGEFTAEAAIQAAEIHLAQNAADRARRAIEPAARAGEKSAAYFTTQGRIALASGDEEGAMQAFETALRTDRNYAGAYLERGLLNVRREALGPGLADLDQYLTLVGDRGAGTRVEEVRALADQLRQAAQGPDGTELAREGGV